MKLNGSVFVHSCHASLEYDTSRVLQHIGLTVPRSNSDRGAFERPAVIGYNDQDFGEEIRGRVQSLTCREEDFEGCDYILMFNPADFHMRLLHFAQFRPTVMILHGQWIERQLDELAGAMNKLVEEGKPCRGWIACYTRREETELLKRLRSDLHGHVRHIRYAKDFAEYYPWKDPETFRRYKEAINDALFTGNTKHRELKVQEFSPARMPFIYTSVHSMKERAEACCYEQWKQIVKDLPHLFSGRRSEEDGGMGLITFMEQRQLYRTCGVYVSVPAWPAPWVLNANEAMCSGAPIAYFDNDRGIAEEGIFDNDVGCCSKDPAKLREYTIKCLKDEGFRAEQSAKVLARSIEFFDFETQCGKWVSLFNDMAKSK